MAKQAGAARLAGLSLPDRARAAPSDDELADRARHDPAAFAPLYARYLDLVYRYCYRRLGNREAAEDATSLIFTKALAALPRYRAGSFRSWLFAIAHNVMTDHYREGPADLSLIDAPDVPDCAATPEEVAIDSEDAQEVRALLLNLPPDQRRILELRLAGLTGREIAVVLGRSHGSVKLAQFHAFARLRAIHTKQEADDARGG